MGTLSVSPQNGSPQTNDDFQAAMNRRMAALPLKVRGYLSLAAILLGMVLFGLYGPNDIWTSLLVGAVFGGIAVNLAIQAFFAAIEAWYTRRLHLAVAVIGILIILAILYRAQ